MFCRHPAGDRHKNVVMWMDHRAEEQAARITKTGHGALSRVGGIMSPELQPPKLLWLKEVRGEAGRCRSAPLCPDLVLQNEPDRLVGIVR